MGVILSGVIQDEQIWFTVVTAKINDPSTLASHLKSIVIVYNKAHLCESTPRNLVT